MIPGLYRQGNSPTLWISRVLLLPRRHERPIMEVTIRKFSAEVVCHPSYYVIEERKTIFAPIRQGICVLGNPHGHHRFYILPDFCANFEFQSLRAAFSVTWPFYHALLFPKYAGVLQQLN